MYTWVVGWVLDHVMVIEYRWTPQKRQGKRMEGLSSQDSNIVMKGTEFFKIEYTYILVCYMTNEDEQKLEIFNYNLVYDRKFLTRQVSYKTIILDR